MANKTNNKTFADRAKSLISKYSRAKFDATEKAELDAALAKLSEEQEAYKQANKIGEYSEASQGQINMRHDGETPGSTSQIIDFTDPLALSNTLNLKLQNPTEATQPSNQYGLSLDYSFNNKPSTGASVKQGDQDTGFSSYKTSIIPSLISGASSAIGNLMLANKAKDYEKLNLPRLTKEQISLANERRSSKRQADVARANTLRNIKSGARTRGELLGNISASEAAMQRNLSDILGGSYQREAQMNAAERARVNQANAQMAAQEAQYNANLANQSMANRQAYQAAAMQAIPQTVGDINKIRQQDALINSLGQDYGIAQYRDPNLNFFQRLTTPKQTVYKYRG